MNPTYGFKDCFIDDHKEIPCNFRINNSHHVTLESTVDDHKDQKKNGHICCQRAAKNPLVNVYIAMVNNHGFMGKLT